METVQQVTAISEGRIPVGAVNADHARRLLSWFADAKDR
jgi:hypothetical protein